MASKIETCVASVVVHNEREWHERGRERCRGAGVVSLRPRPDPVPGPRESTARPSRGLEPLGERALSVG